MAELAIRLSKTVVQGALSKVQSAIEEDAKLRQKAQGDLVAITLEFEMMQSFLDVAKEESVMNSMVKTWVRHVRELAYDLEDCVEFVVHLDNTPDWWRRLLPSCCVALPLPLDQAVAQLGELKRRVVDVNNCYRRYSNITDSKSKLVMMMQDRSSVHATAFVEEIKAAKVQRGDLTQLLADHSIPVISLWSTGGDHGITSIIWKAYYDQEICQKFTRRAWVKLMRPFNPHEFVRSLKDQFYASACKEQPEKVIGLDVLRRTTSEANQGDHLDEFERQLIQERYLVVLEDLSNMADWDAISKFFPTRKNGSCIIVTTQQSLVAALSVGRGCEVLDLIQPAVDHAVYAFYKEDSHSVDIGDKGKTIADSVFAKTLKDLAAEDWMSKHPLVGRESEMNDLLGCTLETLLDSIQVISVWGIAGVGKTALVKTFFCSIILTDCSSLEKYRPSRFDKYGWVDVSHPFSLKDVGRQLLLTFHSESLQAKDIAHQGMVGSTNPLLECQSILRHRRCLVVIDGLQSTREWDLIKAHLVAGSHHNCFVVIAAEERLATHCSRYNRELELNVKVLQTDASLELFRKKVSASKYPLHDSLYDDGAEELQELVSKCGGLPKVICEIASLLGNDPLTPTDYARGLSRNFMQYLKINQEFEDLLVWISNHIRTCPDSIKPCIFYLPIFPRSHVFRRRRLVRRWIAEGYSRDNSEESAEDNGENNFSKLLDMCILEHPTQNTVIGDTRMVMSRVNGFMHECIVSRHMEENFVFQLGGISALTTQRTGRHLTILEDWARDKIVFNSIDFSRLRSLTVFGHWESFFISKSMKLLRVLDLEDVSGVNNADLEKMVKLLGRLKFLSLRGCVGIFNLPSSIGDLRQLQTMDVRDTSIFTLPENIIKLQKLQYIRAGRSTRNTEASASPVSSSWLSMFYKRCELGCVVVPEGIAKLTGLHTLGVVNLAVPGSKAVLKDLKELTQLRKLGVSGVNRKNSMDFFLAISRNIHLETLSVQLGADNENCLDEFTLPSRLRSLKLYGLGYKLPKWSNCRSGNGWADQFSRLAKLDLEMATLEENDIEFLGKLPQLCILRVKQLRDGELHFQVRVKGEEHESYQKVKLLHIACGSSSSNLQVTFGSKAMTKLELLNVECCRWCPSYKFSDLENLGALKQVLLLNGYNTQKLEEELESQLANHPSSVKPVVKLEQ